MLNGINNSHKSLFKNAIIVFGLMINILYSTGYLITIPIDTVAQTELAIDSISSLKENINTNLSSIFYFANGEIIYISTNIIDQLWSYNNLVNSSYSNSIYKKKIITPLLILNKFNSYHSKYDDHPLIS